MKHEFRLADIGEGLEEAEIVSWLVAVGDRVERDQPLVEVMTDKSNAELPSPAAGVLVQIGGAIGDIITVGELVAVIEGDRTVPTDDAVTSPADTPAVTAAAPTAAVRPLSTAAPLPEVNIDATSAPRRPKASPSTRRAALEQGIDLATITGSGPGNRILLADLEAAATVAATPIPSLENPTPQAQVAPQLAPSEPQIVTTPVAPSDAPPPTGTVPLRGVRRAIAKNMVQSWSEIPHIHSFQHIDAEPLLQQKNRLRDTDRPAYARLTPLAFFVAAVGRALRAHPEANASIDMTAESVTYHPDVNIGIAVAAPQGLVVPVLRHADRLDFETLSLTLDQLIREARSGSLAAEHFRGGTATITNFGSLGGEQATPLIRPPESIIIGFGSIAARPFVITNDVVARQSIHLVAGADHRLVDGDLVTALLSHIGDLLTDPLQLVL